MCLVFTGGRRVRVSGSPANPFSPTPNSRAGGMTASTAALQQGALIRPAGNTRLPYKPTTRSGRGWAPGGPDLRTSARFFSTLSRSVSGGFVGRVRPIELDQPTSPVTICVGQSRRRVSSIPDLKMPTMTAFKWQELRHSKASQTVRTWVWQSLRFRGLRHQAERKLRLPSHYMCQSGLPWGPHRWTRPPRESRGRFRRIRSPRWKERTNPEGH